jgi:hypothetical protein
MADLEEDDTSSNAARHGVPALSSLESARKASETSSFEPSSGVPSVSIEYGNTLTEDTESAQRQDLHYMEMPESLEDDTKEGIDTSWDQITPKFKEARHAMYNEHEAGVPLRFNVRGFERLAPNIVVSTTRSVPSEGAASSHESSEEQPSLQRREETNFEPRPPSLRERVGRITSNILSPFRSRKEDYPVLTDEDIKTYPSRSEMPSSVFRERESDGFTEQPFEGEDPILNAQEQRLLMKGRGGMWRSGLQRRETYGDLSKYRQ